MSIKVFLTVRNRLGITKKCITALYQNTKRNLQIHVYDNLSNYRTKNHFEYAYNLYNHGLIASYNFNTVHSTFNAFSKAVSSNQFGLSHKLDPKRNNYDFLLIIDNDIIVLPGWDEKIMNAWNYVKNKNMNNVKIIGQLPGGIKSREVLKDTINGSIKMSIGKLGGSGFWCVRPDFFEDVGFLDINKLIGKNKQHDIQYWQLLNKSSNSKPYIIGLHSDLCIHCGKHCGSICNVLSKNINKNKEEKEELIKFQEADDRIEKMDFKTFMNMILKDKSLKNEW
jgi:hypothetical protein